MSDVIKDADRAAVSLESGDSNPASRLLNSLTSEERLLAAREIENKIAVDRLANPSQHLPSVKLEMDKDPSGKEYISKLEVTAERHRLDPARLIGSETSVILNYEDPAHPKPNAVQRWVADHNPISKALDKAAKN